MKPKPPKKHHLIAGDVVVTVFDDPAYMGLLDLETYDKDLRDWNYQTLTKKIIAEMNAGHIVAWGCPEVALDVRITTAPFRGTAVASTTGKLVTQGLVCLAGYTSLTMCAQFPEYRFPQPEDHLIEVEPGTYRVDVHRLFEHRDGEQFPEPEELPPGDHYVVVLTRDAAMSDPIERVAWALP